MVNRPSPLRHAVPDASLVAKWYATNEPGTPHAQLFLDAVAAGTLRFIAPEHFKTEVVRVLQLGVRDKKYSVEDGWERVEDLLALPMTYVSNDRLLEEAFRLASHYLVSLYDALYLALAHTLELSFITADARFYRLAQQRHLEVVAWYEDVIPMLPPAPPAV
jgi:predicted nucleic acid-binding protein